MQNQPVSGTASHRAVDRAIGDPSLPRDPSSHHAERRSARQQARGGGYPPFFDFSYLRFDPSGKSEVCSEPIGLI